MIIEKEELNIYEVESLHQKLLKEFESESVSIDMKNVNKIDMSVIQLFVSIRKSCLDSLKQFELQNVTSEVLKILEDSACNFLVGAKNE